MRHSIQSQISANRNTYYQFNIKLMQKPGIKFHPYTYRASRTGSILSIKCQQTHFTKLIV